MSMGSGQVLLMDCRRTPDRVVYACSIHVDADSWQGEHSPPDVHVSSRSSQSSAAIAGLQLAMTVQFEAQK